VLPARLGYLQNQMVNFIQEVTGKRQPDVRTKSNFATLTEKAADIDDSGTEHNSDDIRRRGYKKTEGMKSRSMKMWKEVEEESY
jgi:hypothetical protein